MSVNFDPVSSSIGTSLVNSSSSSSASIAPSSSTESSTFYKLIAFPSNSASSSSLSVNSQDNNKNYQHNDQQECLDNNLMVKHCLSESTSPSSSALISSKSSHYDTSNELRRALDNRYSRVKGLDQEWYSARKRQLDEILVKLQHLHKLNLDDRENIEGMKKKTIKLIATYSNITMKTNNFLTRWERKHGSKLKSYQNSPLSSSSPTPSTFSSSDVYGDKYEPDFLFNTSRAW